MDIELIIADALQWDVYDAHTSGFSDWSAMFHEGGDGRQLDVTVAFALSVDRDDEASVIDAWIVTYDLTSGNSGETLWSGRGCDLSSECAHRITQPLLQLINDHSEFTGEDIDDYRNRIVEMNQGV